MEEQMSIEAMKQAHQVPLVEQLESVPADARLVIDDADGMGTRFIPVGRMCREAAAALRTAIEQSEKQAEPFGYFQYDVKLDAWVKSKTNNGIAFYTTPPAAQSQDLNGGHQLDVAGHASTATITKWSYRDCGSEGWFIAETVAAPGGLLPQQEPVAWDDLLGAVARGWGHSKNAHKEMDSDLAIAIAEEVKSLLKEKNA
jgi:hypothetical protein